MKKVMILVLLISLFLIPSQSFALSCAEPPPVEVAIAEYDAVVIGSVKGVESSGGAKKLTIEVEKSFKGVRVNKIIVYEDMTWGESQEGATYLFFLNEEKDNWIHPLCSPTTHSTELADEYFTDQDEITLQDVESFNSESNNTLTIVIVAALLLGILATSLWVLSVKKRRSS